MICSASTEDSPSRDDAAVVMTHGACRRSDGRHVRPLVARCDDGQHASLRGRHQGDIVRSGDAPERAADRVVDNVDAVRDGRVDRVRQVRCVAARTQISRPQPARLVDGDAGPGCDAFDVADQRTEDGSTRTVAGCRGRRVRTMPVDVSRRADFAFVDGTRFECTIDEPAGTDQLVVAVRINEPVTGLARAVPGLRRFVRDDVRRPAVTATQPATEQRRFTPAGAAQLRAVRLAGVGECRVLGRDAAVDEADDDVLAVQALCAP